MVVEIGVEFRQKKTTNKRIKILKKFFFVATVFCLNFCSENQILYYNSENLVRGKLVIKGICMNYVIEVLGNNIDKNLIEKSWTNEFTEISYENVFGLGSICDFPKDIDEGDEFSFSILEEKDQICANCKAYSPTPKKKLFIEVY